VDDFVVDERIKLKRILNRMGGYGLDSLAEDKDNFRVPLAQ
jgi:hypothetical protein